MGKYFETGKPDMAQMRRDEKVQSTREAILNAAERLFGEFGIHAVSNRQISDAAGQGNNAAVSYHFGTKADVLAALVDRHSTSIDSIRARLIADITDRNDLRQWVVCAVRSVTEHMEALGTPSWYARFMVQLLVDPAYRSLGAATAQSSGRSLAELRDGITRCLPQLPAGVAGQRAAMSRHLISQMALEREMAANGGAGIEISEDALADAIVSLWNTPVKAVRHSVGARFDA